MTVITGCLSAAALATDAAAQSLGALHEHLEHKARCSTDADKCREILQQATDVHILMGELARVNSDIVGLMT